MVRRQEQEIKQQKRNQAKTDQLLNQLMFGISKPEKETKSLLCDFDLKTGMN